MEAVLKSWCGESKKKVVEERKQKKAGEKRKQLSGVDELLEMSKKKPKTSQQNCETSDSSYRYATKNFLDASNVSYKKKDLRTTRWNEKLQKLVTTWNVFIAMAFSQGKIALKNLVKFDNHHINKANRYTMDTLAIVIPKPHVYRHLYCTHDRAEKQALGACCVRLEHNNDSLNELKSPPEELSGKLSTVFGVQQWQAKVIEVPQQKDGCSCGVFVNSFPRKTSDHDYDGLYFQMGKSNGHKWFKVGRKEGVDTFVEERDKFREQAVKVEETFGLAFMPWEGSTALWDKTGKSGMVAGITSRRGMITGITSRRGMITVNFNPLWHIDKDHGRWTACTSLGCGKGKSHFAFPEYEVWTDLKRDVAWF
eukprot:g10092.t1